MGWRNSPYFQRQFALVCKRGNPTLEAPFTLDVLNSDDDQALMVFSDWLEEHDDMRSQYIRDMCELSGSPRPSMELFDRVNAFEDSQESPPPLFFRSLPTCTVAMVSHSMRDLEAQRRVPTEFGRAFIKNADNRFIFDMQRARFVTAEFLGNLISFMRVTRDSKRDFPVLITIGTVREVFQITRLNQIFPVCGSLDEAIDVIEGPTPPSAWQP